MPALRKGVGIRTVERSNGQIAECCIRELYCLGAHEVVITPRLAMIIFVHLRETAPVVLDAMEASGPKDLDHKMWYGMRLRVAEDPRPVDYFIEG